MIYGQASEHTRGCYRRDAARLLAHVGKPLTKVTLADLYSFTHSLVALAPISRARSIAGIKSLFGFCQRMGFISGNPAGELALPRYEIRLSERILDEVDVDKMLATDVPQRDRALLHLLYSAGLRVSEACQLRWRNLRPNGDAGQISVFGKNGRTRSVALPAGVWKELMALRGSAGAEDPVFRSRSGKPLDRGRIRMIVRRAAESVGVTGAVSPHWLRHAHASHALDHGAPLSLVRDTLGHASISTTSAYLHARPGDSSARFLVIREQAKPAVAPKPKTQQAATVAQQARRVAPDADRSGKNASIRYTHPKLLNSAKSTPEEVPKGKVLG